jgi:hypothetical protein
MDDFKELNATEFAKMARSFADLGDAVTSQVADALNEDGNRMEDYNTDALMTGAEWLFFNGWEESAQVLEDMVERIKEGQHRRPSR